MKNLVSVIVPTRNSARFLNACLTSLKNQTYPHLEIIIVDNHSTDETLTIARRFTPHIFIHRPERSTQRNYGARKAKGKYLYFVDADFNLDPKIIAQCVNKIAANFDAVVVHNTPDPQMGLLARIRHFEVQMYKYDLGHSAARFFRKAVFASIGGYNEDLTAYEDYDLQNRLNGKGFQTGFIDAEAIHLDETRSFWQQMKRYYIYGQKLTKYKQANPKQAKTQLAFFRPVYFKNWKKCLHHPILSILFIIYHSCKFLFGGLGYLSSALKHDTQD